jgi:CubicO group peptidase (beta-lactamase class C family)
MTKEEGKKQPGPQHLQYHSRVDISSHRVMLPIPSSSTMARWTSLAALALAAVSAAAEDSTQIPLALGHGSGVVLTDALRAKLSGVLVKHGVPGYALALVRPGGIEFTNWGNATEDGRPMAPDVRCRPPPAQCVQVLMRTQTTITLASVSKAFTATALGLLIDDYAHGRNATPLPPTLRTLSWASKLVDVLPEWGVPDGDIRAHLSLRDALSHVSGLPRHDFVYARGQSAEDLLGMFPHLRAAYELCASLLLH